MNRIVGIDCATQPEKVGLALAEHSDDGIRILEARTGGQGVESTVLGWIGEAPSLLAMDAPLGWPEALPRALAEHAAGSPVRGRPSELFSRLADHAVFDRVGKRPLEVGADRIARTALAAIKLLNDLRCEARAEIPLAWEPGVKLTGDAAIEVYPAGTLRSLGILDFGYKKPVNTDARSRILRELRERVRLTGELAGASSNADVLDAVICTVAGADFLGGSAIPPTPDELPTARREGWIWIRPTR